MEAKDHPAEQAVATKESLSECALWEFVHESNIKPHLRNAKYIEHLPELVFPAFAGEDRGDYAETVHPPTMMFARKPLHNGESMFQRIR